MTAPKPCRFPHCGCETANYCIGDMAAVGAWNASPALQEDVETLCERAREWAPHVDGGEEMVAALRAQAAVLTDLERQRDAASRMRGEALGALSLMESQRNALERKIAGESRISDSDMMALLRRVNKQMEADLSEARAENARLREELRLIAMMGYRAVSRARAALRDKKQGG